MANRHGDFNELLASKFEDIKFSQAYISALINIEGMSLEEALRETIIAMGLQSFATKAEVSIQYVSDLVNRRKRLSIKSIDKYLQKAFQLRVKMSVESFTNEVA